MAGYSSKALFEKLGIKSGTRVVLRNAPGNYRKLLGKLPTGVEFASRSDGSLDFGHLFTAKRSDLEKHLKDLRSKLSDAGTVWVSWPKKSSGVRSDVTEQVIRDVALPLGLVDTKVCAVDETWSGLKLVIRRQNRRSTVV
jgi:hypothetical protein